MNPEAYDAWYDSERGRWIGETELALVLGLLAPQSGDRILDVGCGSGWFTRRLSGLAGVGVVGVDVDEASLAFGRRCDPRTGYLLADALSLPFAEGCFDLTVSITALGFTGDWRRALQEIVRVTRRRFVIGLLNRNSLLWRQKGKASDQGAYAGAHWHTATEVLRALDPLRVENVVVRSAILLPAAGALARVTERIVGHSTRFGSFLLIAGDRRHDD